MLALEVWSDIQGIGSIALELCSLELDDDERGQLLESLRAISGEAAAIRMERAQAAEAAGNKS